MELPLGDAGCHPGKIFFGGTGVYDNAVFAFANKINDEVIDHAADFVQHGAIEGLAGNFELVDVIRYQSQQKCLGIRSSDIDGAHVRYVEHATIGTNCMMFFNLRTVVHRHVPAAEIDHLCAHAAMSIV